MTMNTALGAASAYANVAGLANPANPVQDRAVDSADFGSMVRDAVAGVVESGRASEGAQTDLMAGKADVIDVVTAVAETELAMQTMVSVRDKVISAYEEIMRMPI